MKKNHLSPVLPYWDLSEKELSHELRELKESGTQTIGAWIPWSHLEKDKSHSLEKLLSLSIHMDLTPRLVISPELNSLYNSRVIPGHLLQNKENLAKDAFGRTIYNFSQPSIYPLVDLSKKAIQKAYESFLLLLSKKLKNILSKYKQARVDLIIGDSFFKYYGNTKQKNTSSSTYLENDLTTKEYYFRSISSIFLGLELEEYKNVKLLNRTFSIPNSSIENLLEEILRVNPSVSAIFKKIKKDSSRYDSIYFSDLEKFNSREKNFLISSSLVLHKDVWINSKDYLNSSQNFKNKIQHMTNFLREESLYKPVMMLTKSRYQHSKLSQRIHDRMGAALKIYSVPQEISSADLTESKLLIIEKEIKNKDLMRLLKLAEKSRINIISFWDFLSSSSINSLKTMRSLNIKHKWDYEIFPLLSGGNFIIVDDKIKSDMDIELLIDKMLYISNISKVCNYSEKRLTFASTKNKVDKNKRTLFFMNDSSKRIKTKLSFPSKVILGTSKSEEPGSDFNMELPPYSLVPTEVAFIPDNLKEANKMQHNEALNE